MTAIEIACRHVDTGGWNCGAEEGEPCTYVSIIGDRLALEDGVFHSERILDAASAGVNVGDEQPSVAAFDKAVAKELFG